MSKPIILIKSTGVTKGFNLLSAALNLATPGVTIDTITVYPGIYNEQIILKDGVNIFCLPGVTITSNNASGTIIDNGVEVHLVLSGEPTVINTIDQSLAYNLTNANSKIDASNDFTDLLISGSLSISGSLIVTGSIELKDVEETNGQTNHLVWSDNKIKYQLTPISFITESANKVYLTQPEYYFSVTNSFEMTGSLDSDITLPAPAYKEGRLFYDSANHTYAIYNDISDITLQLGQETIERVIAGELIPNGSPVYISGSQDTYPIIYLALADGTRNEKFQVIGISTHEIASGSQGFVTVRGRVNDIDTSAFNDGDELYLSYTDSGSFTNMIPPSPYEIVLCGHCLYSSASAGKILVDINVSAEYSNASVGIVDEPLFTDNGSGTFTVGTGSVNLNTRPDGKGIIKNYRLAETQFELTSSVLLDVHYICACYNSGSPEYRLLTDRTSIDNIQSTIVSTVTYGVGSVLSHRTWDAPGILLANKLYSRINENTGIERSTGLIIGVSGSRYVTATEGIVWQGVNSFTLPQINSAPISSGGLASRIVQLVKSASVWSGSVVTQYNNSQYNAVNGLQILGSGDFTVNWLYRGVGNLNSTIIVLGTQSFTNISNAIESQPPETPSELDQMSVLLGRAIYKRYIDTIQELDTAFTQVFVPAGITNHNLLNGLQGGTIDEYYHLTSNEYTGTGTGVMVKQINPIISGSLTINGTITSSGDFNIAVLTGSYTASNNYDIYFISGSGSINLYLYDTNMFPSSSIKIKLLNNLNLTIYPSGSQLIEFDTTATLDSKGQAIELIPFNENWYVT